MYCAGDFHLNQSVTQLTEVNSIDPQMIVSSLTVLCVCIRYERSALRRYYFYSFLNITLKKLHDELIKYIKKVYRFDLNKIIAGILGRRSLSRFAPYTGQFL